MGADEINGTIHCQRSIDMKLEIADKTAIVCASSSGLGKGCAMALAKEGVTLVINGLPGRRHLSRDVLRTDRV
jgi:NAD(P)-dependent dehydrogenase (short-subunit alcohol dehydrogenase family)